MTTAAIAQPGHNLPPRGADIERARLEDKFTAQIKRAGLLVDAMDRVPPVIEDDETAGKTGDFIKQVTAHRKMMETARVSEKEPHLELGRVVDGFFKRFIDPLDTVKKTVESRLGVFLRQKEEAERRARLEAERIAREESQRKEAEALALATKDVAGSEKALDAAVAAEAQAVEAGVAAEAKPAELARTRGDYGSVSTLRTSWDFEIDDRSKIPLDALRPYLAADAVDKAVRAFVRAGGRDLAGVRIFENRTAMVR